MAIETFELEPTRDNIIYTIRRDLLGRNESVSRFVKFCNAQNDSCSIALDAKWGHGKTFFIKQTQLLLESLNEQTSSVTDNEKQIVKSAFSPYLDSRGDYVEIEPHVCVYYDAWANDNDNDPMLSIIYETIKESAQYASFTKRTDCLSAASLIADFFTGRNVADIANRLKQTDILIELKEKKEISESIKDFIDSLLYEQGNRLIIFIDELDRCRPDYAIKLLERIKHYFSNNKVTFVFAVNMALLYPGWVELS